MEASTAFTTSAGSKIVEGQETTGPTLIVDYLMNILNAIFLPLLTTRRNSVGNIPKRRASVSKSIKILAEITPFFKTGTVEEKTE